MHQNVPVVEIELIGKLGEILQVNAVHHINHLPVGVQVDANKGLINVNSLSAWFRGRSISASRQQIDNLKAVFSETEPHWLIEKSYGLSLSDQYWIKPLGSFLAWAEINFFDNDFSEDIGNILFGQESSGVSINFLSPDNTSDGWLKKRWKIIEGKRFLIKGASSPYRQEPYNEVIASCLMKRLKIKHVTYELFIDEQAQETYSICENFITKDTELVSAWYVMQQLPMDGQTPKFPHLLKCCERLGIVDAKQRISEMIVVDYLIANTDRHVGNFGFVRNAKTLEWIGFAPIFDNGSSLWYDETTFRIRSDRTLKSKPFKGKHHEQINLINDFNWLDLNCLDGIESEIIGICQGAERLNDERIQAISNGVCARIEDLRELIRCQQSG